MSATDPSGPSLAHRASGFSVLVVRLDHLASNESSVDDLASHIASQDERLYRRCAVPS
jgi:hypothetical protein